MHCTFHYLQKGMHVASTVTMLRSNLKSAYHMDTISEVTESRWAQKGNAMRGPGSLSLEGL